MNDPAPATNLPRIDALTGADMPKPQPAATVVIFRDQPGDTPPDLLLVERSAKMAFAAGAAVFPGGRVDDADYAFATAMGLYDVEEGGARLAAIRESLEETGVAIALDGDLEPARLVEARRALHDGTALSDICRSFDWHPQLDLLIPFARWCPPFAERRVFDTRFYLARHDDHAADATVDATENYNLFWSSAAGVLDKAEQGLLKIIFPTRRNLERLAQFNDFAEAQAHAAQYPVSLIGPHIAEENGEKYLCIPEGMGYPITRETLVSASRG